MRISDWGSDVCSSDLEDAAFGHIFCAKPGVDQWVGIEREAHGRFFPFADRNRITTAATDRVTLSRHEHLEAEPADRKSVVQGKSVSVRVDLGGRRIIKKKKQKKNKHHTNTPQT